MFNFGVMQFGRGEFENNTLQSQLFTKARAQTHSNKTKKLHSCCSLNLDFRSFTVLILSSGDRLSTSKSTAEKFRGVAPDLSKRHTTCWTTGFPTLRLCVEASTANEQTTERRYSTRTVTMKMEDDSYDDNDKYKITVTAMKESRKLRPKLRL